MTTSYYSEPSFFDAWLRGVEIAGPRWFGDGTGRGNSKWEFEPQYDAINGAIGWLASGEAAFLAPMYSFYNATAGGKMLRRLQLHGMADIAAALDEPRRRVIADLLVAYGGW
jgi:hypothetical protein